MLEKKTQLSANDKTKAPKHTFGSVQTERHAQLQKQKQIFRISLRIIYNQKGDVLDNLYELASPLIFGVVSSD